MSPAISETMTSKMNENQFGNSYQKGIKYLCENGIDKVPRKYILPIQDRPNITNDPILNDSNIRLPVIDFAQLLNNNRSQVLNQLAKACEHYGFFQVVNHNVPIEVITRMNNVCRRFFEQPFEERAKYMSSNMKAPVRYGTSFNQNKDGVFCWRDFLKLDCTSLHDKLAYWPSSPQDLRKDAATYSKETKNLFEMLMEAILESLGVIERERSITKGDDEIIKEFGNGSQVMVANCYPPCPEPDLTLGMPPHSDYGFLTLLLQDEVKGLQIQYQGRWVTVEPIPNSFVVNVGDHLEIFSNGRYKSVLHRVVVNPAKTRVTVASLHSLPFERIIRPSQKLITKDNPRRYKDTDFATFLDYISSCEPKKKDFLETRKLY